MTRHIWDTKTLRQDTVEMGWEVLRFVVEREASYERAMAFTGYMMERLRQVGRTYRLYLTEQVRLEVPEEQWSGVALRWSKCERTNHRYSRGANASYYRATGERILATLAPKLGLVPSTPAPILWDALLEAGVDRVFGGPEKES